jgi:hypothetical protein
MTVEFGLLQEAAQELGDDVEQHDRAGLEALDEWHLREQAAARDELYDYVDGLWEQAKEAGLDPAVHPQYVGLAGLRDLVAHLQRNAEDVLAQREG